MQMHEFHQTLFDERGGDQPQRIFHQAKQFYPKAHFEVLSGPPAAGEEAGPPSVYFVALQPSDLAAVRGLDLYYRPQDQPDALPLEVNRAFNVNVAWPDQPLFEGETTAEWSGVLYAPRYGPYTLRLSSTGPALLEINGHVILEGQGEQLTTQLLALGNHQIRVQAEVVPGGQVALYWQPPAEGEALLFCGLTAI